MGGVMYTCTYTLEESWLAARGQRKEGEGHVYL